MHTAASFERSTPVMAKSAVKQSAESRRVWIASRCEFGIEMPRIHSRSHVG
jgi:hypothetical protein